MIGEPSGTRTRDPLIKSQMLYRPELTALLNNQKKANLYRLFSALKDSTVPEIVPIIRSFVAFRGVFPGSWLNGRGVWSAGSSRGVQLNGIEQQAAAGDKHFAIGQQGCGRE